MCWVWSGGCKVETESTIKKKKKKTFFHCSVCFQTAVLGHFFQLRRKWRNCVKTGSGGRWAGSGSVVRHSVTLGGGSCYKGYRLTAASLCGPKGQIFTVWKKNCIGGQSEPQHMISLWLWKRHKDQEVTMKWFSIKRKLVLPEPYI